MTLSKCRICGEIFDNELYGISIDKTEHALYKHDGFFDFEKVEEEKSK